MNKSILVIAAHTDDEVLGCGGTIAKHVAKGDDVYAVFLSDGVTSRTDSSKQKQNNRNLAANKAHKILGIKRSFMLGFPDNCMDKIPLLEIIQKLEQVVIEVRPHTIYTHHIGDLNIDHRITHQAALTACRPTPGSTIKEIYSFEVMSSTEWNTPGLFPFLPSVFVDISKYHEIKIEALKAYELEMRNPPHTRSIENVKRLAELRGNCVGLNAAEAMMAVRVIS